MLVVVENIPFLRGYNVQSQDSPRKAANGKALMSYEDQIIDFIPLVHFQLCSTL